MLKYAKIILWHCHVNTTTSASNHWIHWNATINRSYEDLEHAGPPEKADFRDPPNDKNNQFWGGTLESTTQTKTHDSRGRKI